MSVVATSWFFSVNQNLKQIRGTVFSHKEDSRAFRQLNVPCLPTLYAGLLLFPAVAVFAKLSTKGGCFSRDFHWPFFSRPVTLILFYALSSVRGCYQQRTFATSFHYLVRLFAAAFNSSMTILELA